MFIPINLIWDNRITLSAFANIGWLHQLNQTSPAHEREYWNPILDKHLILYVKFNTISLSLSLSLIGSQLLSLRSFSSPPPLYRDPLCLVLVIHVSLLSTLFPPFCLLSIPITHFHLSLSLSLAFSIFLSLSRFPYPQTLPYSLILLATDHFLSWALTCICT